jgi:hypothetical protein
MKSPALLKLIKSVLVVTCLAVMSGCGPKTSPHQRQQLAKLLESGTRLNSAVKAGVSFKEFQNLFAEYNAAIELVNSNLPEALSAQAKENINESKSCWSFAEKAWGLEVKYGRNVDDWPLEIPNALSKVLPTRKAPVGAFAGKEVANVSEAVKAGLTVGTVHFELLKSDLNKLLNN